MPTRRPPFAESLRHWRTLRRFSQLALAHRAGTPPRHLSFLETGRARPSEAMVLRLADALELPLAERNALLRAAGFAPAFPERPLDDAAMAGVRFVIERLLAAHAPLPALVLDAAYNIVQANVTARRLLLGHADPSPDEPANLVALLLGPLRPMVVNWDDVGTELLTRLHRDVAAAGADPRLRTLLARAESLLATRSARDPQASDGPVLLTRLRTPLGELRTLSTLVHFGGARDVTVAGLHVELIYPADDASEALLRALAS